MVDLQGYANSLAHITAQRALAFRTFFESKYPDQKVQCPYIDALFKSVTEWAVAREAVLDAQAERCPDILDLFEGVTS